MAVQLSTDDLCRLQTALLLAQGLVQPTEEALRQLLLQSLNLHNLGEYSVSKQHGPCETLLAVTDGRVTVGAECKTQVKLAPTIYLVLGDYRNPQGEMVPTLATFYCSWRASTYIDVPKGGYLHGLASWVADQLPLQTLFSYLGEGYHVVLAGYGFGGLVAHALAVRLVLNVRNEINTAKQMGINLSALAQTENKVCSFAFGSPLLANATLAQTLNDVGLAAGLHTIWRVRDGAPKFLTLCAELATAVDGRVAAEHYAPPSGSAVQFGLKTQHLQVVQGFANVLCKELKEALSTRNRANQATFMCSPLDLGALTNITTPELDADAAAAANGGATPGSPAHDSSDHNRTSVPGKLPHNLIAAVKSSSGTDHMAHDYKRSVSSGDRASPKGAGIAAARAAATASKTSLGAAAVAATAAARMAGRAVGKTMSMSGNELPPKPALVTAAPATEPAKPVAPAAGWKAALRTLFTKGSAVDAAAKCAPLGNFWLVEPCSAPRKAAEAAAGVAAKGVAAARKAGAVGAGAKAGAAAGADSGGALVELSHVAPGKVLATLSEGLTESNSELLQCWEWGLEELRKDLMEAFPWVLFRTAVTVDSEVMAREPCVRPSKALILE